MEMTKNQYKKYVDKKVQKSNLPLDMLWAFLIGGAICTVGQGVLNLYGYLGIDKQDAFAFTSMTMIFLGALLTGLNLYDNIAKKGGAGTLVPITGFSNAMVSSALEFKSEGLVLGTAVKMFTIAGPVIVYGISGSIIYGLIIYIFKLF